jgi:hypothetical protein
LAAYLPADGRLQAYGIMMLTVVAGAIQTTSGFQRRLAVSLIRPAPNMRSMSVSSWAGTVGGMRWDAEAASLPDPHRGGMTQTATRPRLPASVRTACRYR